MVKNAQFMRSLNWPSDQPAVIYKHTDKTEVSTVDTQERIQYWSTTQRFKPEQLI